MPIVQTLHNLQKRYQSPAVHLYGVYMVVLLCVIRCDFCHLLTYLLTSRCRVLLEKLTGLQLVKKFPAFHGTQRLIFITQNYKHTKSAEPLLTFSSESFTFSSTKQRQNYTVLIPTYCSNIQKNSYN